MDGQTWAIEMQKSWEELPACDADIVAEAIDNQMEEQNDYGVADDLADLRHDLEEIHNDASLVSTIIACDVADVIKKLEVIQDRFEKAMSDSYEKGYNDGFCGGAF